MPLDRRPRWHPEHDRYYRNLAVIAFAVVLVLMFVLWLVGTPTYQ